MEAQVRLGLLRGFELRNGAPMHLPTPAQRVVALVALHGSIVRRGYIAGALWPDMSDERAGANLRSAMWRIRQPGPAVVDSIGGHLTLCRNVIVDLHHSTNLARTLPTLGSDAEIMILIERFEAELLPDWYEDWLLLWRERWQRTRVAALERLSEELRAASRFNLSVHAASAAVRAEPLRESSRKGLILAYLAEGNSAQAHQELNRFERVLDFELGIRPSAALVEMVRGQAVRG